MVCSKAQGHVEESKPRKMKNRISPQEQTEERGWGNNIMCEAYAYKDTMYIGISHSMYFFL